MTNLFNWVVDNGYFNVVKFCAFVHDESDIESPKEIANQVAEKVQYYMEESASYFCKSLPIPAVPDVAEFWKH